MDADELAAARHEPRVIASALVAVARRRPPSPAPAEPHRRRCPAGRRAARTRSPASSGSCRPPAGLPRGRQALRGGRDRGPRDGGRCCSRRPRSSTRWRRRAYAARRSRSGRGRGRGRGRGIGVDLVARRVDDVPAAAEAVDALPAGVARGLVVLRSSRGGGRCRWPGCAPSVRVVVPTSAACAPPDVGPPAGTGAARSGRAARSTWNWCRCRPRTGRRCGPRRRRARCPASAPRCRRRCPRAGAAGARRRRPGRRYPRGRRPPRRRRPRPPRRRRCHR